MIILKILLLIGAWTLFYTVLANRGKRAPRLKATIITLLFAALIFNVATQVYNALLQHM